MSKLPMMTIDQLFQWRDRSVAERNAFTPGTAKFERISNRIAAIDAILDTALAITIGEVAPDIKAYLKLTTEDVGTLQAFMPKAFIKALPTAGTTQVQIDFQTAEDVEYTPVQPSKNKVEIEIANLMSKNFVDNIPKAVEILIESKGGKKMTNSEAWAEIREICKANKIRIVETWEKYISTLLSNQGPAKIYAYLNDKLVDWPSEDLGVMAGMLIESYITSDNTPMSIAHEKQQELFNALSRENLKKTAKNETIINIIKSKNQNLTDATAAKEAEMVLTLMNPSKRDRVLSAIRKRKTYVEKGYPA